MTSKEAIKSVKDYVLAGNKNLQVLDTLLNNVVTSAVVEALPQLKIRNKKERLKASPFFFQFCKLSSKSPYRECNCHKDRTLLRLFLFH